MGERMEILHDVLLQLLGLTLYSWSRRTCYWYDYGRNPEDQVQRYFDLLGDDVNVARILGGMAATLSFFVFCFLLSFICSSQVRGARLFLAFFMACILTTLQGLTFLIFQSELCEGGNCEFSRGAGFSVAAIVSFFLAGIAFVFTTNYPGDRPIKRGDEDSVNKMLSDEEATRKEEPQDATYQEAEPKEDNNMFQDEEVAGYPQGNDDNVPTADSKLSDAEA